MIKQPMLLWGLLSLAQIGCVTAQPTQQLKVTVRNDQGAVVEEAEVSVQFSGYRGAPEVKTELTGEDGYVEITGEAPLPPNVVVHKEGYYESTLKKVGVVTPSNAKSLIASKSLNLVLRERINPRPLIAKRVEGFNSP